MPITDYKEEKGEELLYKIIFIRMSNLEKCKKFLEEFYIESDNIKEYTYADQLVRIISSFQFPTFI